MIWSKAKLFLVKSVDVIIFQHVIIIHHHSLTRSGYSDISRENSPELCRSVVLIQKARQKWANYIYIVHFYMINVYVCTSTCWLYLCTYIYTQYTCYLYELSCLKSVYSKITVDCISLEKHFTKNLHLFTTKKLKGGHTHTDTLCIEAL